MTRGLARSSPGTLRDTIAGKTRDSFETDATSAGTEMNRGSVPDFHALTLEPKSGVESGHSDSTMGVPGED